MSVHATAALAQLALSLVSVGIAGWLARANGLLKDALTAQRKLTGRTRTPALTRVLPAVHAPRGPLPRFRLTHLDGRLDPDGVHRPPPLP